MLPLAVRTRLRRMTYNATEEGPKERLRRKVVAHFLETKQDATDGSTERNCYTTGSTGAQYLSALSIIVSVFGEYTTGNVSNASRDMHIGPFFTKTETGCHTEDQC